MMSPTARCVYCCEIKTLSRFNREHVIPEAFGLFRDNLVLHNTVCADCNTSLGRDLDRIMARGSLEGTLRLFRGLRAPTHTGRTLKERVRVVLPRPPEWEGVIVYLSASPDGRRIITKLPPQAGLRRAVDGKWEYRTLPEIEKDGFSPGVLAAKDCGIRLAYASEDDGRMLRGALARLQIPFSEEHGIDAPAREGDEIDVVIWGTFDSLSRRAIAKIAFNYLAWKLGANFVLDSAFDGLREFILKGNETDPSPVQVKSDHILGEESANIAITDGHIVTVNWDATCRHIIAQVGLFNTMFYKVLLAKDFLGLYRPDLRSGHLFDWRSKSVRELVRVDRRLLPGI